MKQRTMMAGVVGALMMVGMRASGVPIVVFEDGQVIADQDFNRSFQTVQGDYDTNGIMDEMAIIVYSATQELCSPSSNYVGQPFYGGFVRYYWGQTGVSWPSKYIGRVNTSNQYVPSDFVNLRTQQSVTGPTEKAGCLIWKKQDFLNEGNNVRVDLDPTNSFHLCFESVQFGGIGIRYLVQVGDTLYISQEEDTAEMGGFHEFGLNEEIYAGWFAPYNPAVSLKFDDGSATFQQIELTNVQAVGLYFVRPLTGPEWAPNLQWRFTNFVVEATIVTSGAAQIAVTPGLINFGTVAVGATNYATLMIRNIGTGVLEGSVSNVTPPFFVVGSGTYAIAAGETNLVVLGFAPVDGSAQTNQIICTGGGDAVVTLLGNLPATFDYIVRFVGGEMISQNVEFARGWQIVTGDFGGGVDIDEKALTPFSESQPLAAGPSTAYSGQSLYGGAERIYYDVTGAAANLLGRLAVASSGIVVRMSANAASPTRAVQFFYVDKNDFYNGGDVMPVVLTSDSELYAKINNELYAGGEVRFVVRIGGQFYISSQSYTFDAGVKEYRMQDPTLVFWAEYNPGTDLYFNAMSASFNSLDLEDVTAVGLYCMRNIGSVEQQNLMWKTLEFTATGVVTPEPGVGMVMLAGVGLGLRRRLQG